VTQTQQQQPSTVEKLRSSRWKRWRRIGLIGVVMWLAGVSCLSAIILLYGERDNKRSADVIIVLGSGLRRDGRPGPALTRRSIHGAELWHQGIAPYVMCTGGLTTRLPRSEAEACAEILQQQGVPAESILLEDRSMSTEENAINAHEIMTTQGLNTAVLVSDRYHMLRASWLFSLQGIETYTSPTSEYPNFSTLVYAMTREVMAFQWQALKEVLNLPNTHIGGL
jgi:uncharacterized SAM-binding protein YcdF (DUF218 family)